MMKTIGLLGGMSWESTVPYYQTMNQVVARELGGLNSAKIVMHSVNFQEILDLAEQNCWEEAAHILSKAGRGLKAAGADFLVLGVNTMHKVADQVEQESGLPLLHIIDSTVRRVKSLNIDTIALLGTRYVVEQDFYRGRLEKEHGLNVLIPTEKDRAFIHAIIYEELSKGIFDGTTRGRCREIIATLVSQGAQGVVLACTELPLLLTADDSTVPVFATTFIHAEDAALLALR